MTSMLRQVRWIIITDLSSWPSYIRIYCILATKYCLLGSLLHKLSQCLHIILSFLWRMLCRIQLIIDPPIFSMWFSIVWIFLSCWIVGNAMLLLRSFSSLSHRSQRMILLVWLISIIFALRAMFSVFVDIICAFLCERDWLSFGNFWRRFDWWLSYCLHWRWLIIV